MESSMAMAKRILDDPVAATNGDAHINKKKKRDKSRKKEEDLGVSDVVQTPYDAQKKDAVGGENKKLSKADRKEAKRNKELGKYNIVNVKVRQPLDKVDSENDISAQEKEKKAAVKAARKAEKAELEAGKRAREEAQEDNSVMGAVPASAPTFDEAPETSWNGIDHNTSAVARPSGTGYSQDPNLTALSQEDINSYLKSNFITITDSLSPPSTLRPISSFSFLPGIDENQRAVFRCFSSPTPIQAAAWPFLLSGRDVVGVAETGSGKTLAFGVPCIRYITSLKKGRKSQGVKAVMVSPTRELALQIHEQMVRLATPAGLEVVCVYGGVPKDEQRRALQTAQIVVATPGRLNDLINEGAAELSSASYLVLDEADRMLDKGFEEEIRKIINTTTPSKNRQTLMFTATWPESVRQLANTFMDSPVKIAIGDNPTGELRANTRIVQKVEVVEPHVKEYRLLQLIKEYQSGGQKDDRILVFCLYKKEATRVENFIRMKGFRVAGIHGDLSQAQRTTSLDAFKKGKIPLLVATDVAARGLDIPAVKLVINVTFPLTVEDYVHRIGRTGRAGKEGLAVTFFTEHDKAQSGALINVMKAANQPVPDDLLKFGTTVKKKGHDAYGAFFKETVNSKAATKIKFDA
ncbi:MAG: RNA-dependent ATPase [Pycnora praestabilis]|nr:MAG: RNA-dependent ATPase [Pycnora praestabilis]